MTKSNTREQLLSSARAAFEKKNYSEAVRIFELILGSIDATSASLDHAEARNNLSVALLKNGQPQLALEQALGTDSIFASHGDIEKQAMALGNAGTAQAELKQYDQAFDSLTHSAKLFKQIGNLEMRSFVLHEISVVQMKRGKQVESLFAMDAALDGKRNLTIRESFLKRLMGIVHRVMRTQR